MADFLTCDVLLCPWCGADLSGAVRQQYTPHLDVLLQRLRSGNLPSAPVRCPVCKRYGFVRLASSRTQSLAIYPSP